jgi:SPP1 family phage portal protein
MYTVDKNTQVNTESVKNAIEYNELQSQRFRDLHNYYMGIQPIMERTKAQALANVKIMVNHAKYITDMNVGFLLGNEVEYSYEGEENEDQNNNSALDPVINMYKEQPISDVDVRLGKKASIFGKSFEYIYANEKNKVLSKDLSPLNCIVVYDDTMDHNKLFAVMYSRVEKIVEGITTVKKYKDVIVVNNTNIIDFNEDLKMLDFRLHYHMQVPVVEYLNNEDAVGDFEMVITLIDAYNILQSDRVNDKQQLVEALLVLYGIDLTPKQLVELKENRVMSVPMGTKAEYLVKMLNENDVDVLRKVIEADICKISMTPNFSDENFAGNATGVALQYKLLGFVQNAMNKERSFKKGLLERFEIYNSYLVKASKSKEIPSYDIDVIFKRNLPQNDLETSQMIMNLDGKVSNNTLISRLSFVENADDETKWVEEQKVKDMNLQNQQFGTDVPSVNNAEDSATEDTQNKKQSLMDKMKNLVK